MIPAFRGLILLLATTQQLAAASTSTQQWQQQHARDLQSSSRRGCPGIGSRGVFCGPGCKRCTTNDSNATPVCKAGSICTWKCRTGFVLQTKCDSGGKNCVPKACVRPPPCPPGKWQVISSSSNRTSCQVCGRNTFKSKAGNGPCSPCPAGTFTVGLLPENHNELSDCLPGGLIPTANLTSASFAQSVLDFDDLLDWATDNTGGRRQPKHPGGGSRACLLSSSCPGGFSEASRALAHVAGSPLVYASNDLSVLRSGVNRVSRVRDQGSCGTCVNHCVASAVESAVAAARNIDAASLSVSHVMGYACAPFFDLDDIRRTCSSGSTFADALAAMRQVPLVYFTPEACVAAVTTDLAALDYNLQPAVCRSIRQGCQQDNNWRCTPVLLSQGLWMIQYHVREWGSAMTQIVIGEDFKAFFEANPTGVFSKPGIPAGSFNHAVLLVGYDNVNEYWLIKGSWGDTWADRGFARVAFNAAGIGHPEQTFGVTCEAGDGSTWADVWPATPDPTSPGCFLYTAVSRDHISGIATHFNDDINGFIDRNVKRGVIPVNTTKAADGTQVQEPFLAQDWTGSVFKVCGSQEGSIDRSLAAIGPSSAGTPFQRKCPIGSFITSWRGTSYGNYISGLSATCSDGTQLALAGDFGTGIVYQTVPTAAPGFAGLRVLADSSAVINVRFVFAEPAGQLSPQYGSIADGTSKQLACETGERAGGFFGTAGPSRPDADAPTVVVSLGLICRNLGMPSSTPPTPIEYVGPPEPTEVTDGTKFDYRCPPGTFISTFSGSAESFRIISLGATCSDGSALGPAGAPDAASSTSVLFTEPKPDAIGAGQGFRIVIGRSSQRVGVDGLCFVLASNGAATDCHGAILDSTLGQFILSCSPHRVAGFYGIMSQASSLNVLSSLGIVCRVP